MADCQAVFEALSGLGFQDANLIYLQLLRSSSMVMYKRCDAATLDVDLQGSVFVVNPDKTARQQLNGPEQVVWELLDGDHSISDIAKEVATRLRLPSSQAVAAVSNFVERLRTRGYLKEGNRDGP